MILNTTKQRFIPQKLILLKSFKTPKKSPITSFKHLIKFVYFYCKFFHLAHIISKTILQPRSPSTSLTPLAVSVFFINPNPTFKNKQDNTNQQRQKVPIYKKHKKHPLNLNPTPRIHISKHNTKNLKPIPWSRILLLLKLLIWPRDQWGHKFDTFVICGTLEREFYIKILDIKNWF